MSFIKAVEAGSLVKKSFSNTRNIRREALMLKIRQNSSLGHDRLYASLNLGVFSEDVSWLESLGYQVTLTKRVPVRGNLDPKRFKFEPDRSQEDGTIEWGYISWENACE